MNDLHRFIRSRRLRSRCVQPSAQFCRNFQLSRMFLIFFIYFRSTEFAWSICDPGKLYLQVSLNSTFFSMEGRGDDSELFWCASGIIRTTQWWQHRESFIWPFFLCSLRLMALLDQLPANPTQQVPSTYRACRSLVSQPCSSLQNFFFLLKGSTC